MQYKMLCIGNSTYPELPALTHTTRKWKKYKKNI